MGAILVGSIISTTFQFYKDSTTTSFYFDVYIDTEQVISDFFATDYMYYGRVQGISVTKNNFLSNIYDSVFGTSWRIS